MSMSEQMLTGVETRHATSEVHRDDPIIVVYEHRPDTDAPQNKRGTYQLKMPTMGGLLATKFKERHYLLKPWLREQESCMVYAATGVGKSLFALSAAIAIAGRTQFLGWEPEEKADGSGWRVLYIDGEMHIADIQERARQLRAGMPGLNTKAADANLSLLSRQHQDGRTLFPSITEASGQAFVIQQVKDHKFDLVILDNFTTLGEVEDENAAASFNSIQQFLLGLKTHGVATMLVHHAGKSEENFRGSSKLAATFETIIHLQRPEAALSKNSKQRVQPTSSASGARFRVIWDKVRSEPTAHAWNVSACLEPAKDSGAATWDYVTESTGNRLDDIYHLLSAGEFVSQKEIATFFGVSPPMISKDIEKGRKLGHWTDDRLDRWFGHGKSRRASGLTNPPIPPDKSWRAEALTDDAGDDPFTAF